MKPKSGEPAPKPVNEPAGIRLGEDWLAVILAFLLILLSAIGILGKSGFHVSF
jgi:hypothetical protein